MVQKPKPKITAENVSTSYSPKLFNLKITKIAINFR